MTWRDDGRETLKILALSIGACVAYGIAHDSVTARLCVEYFTVGHPRLIASESPQLLALAWGVVATWWVGGILGVLLSVAARAGAQPSIDARQLVVPVAARMLIVGIGSIAAGSFGYWRGTVALWVHMIVPDEERARCFVADAWAHTAAYGVGFAVGIGLVIGTWCRRARLDSASSASS